jgi:hypothetical protein
MKKNADRKPNIVKDKEKSREFLELVLGFKKLRKELPVAHERLKVEFGCLKMVPRSLRVNSFPSLLITRN